MYTASVEYLNRQWIIPNWGGGLWEQRYIFFPLFSLFVSVYVYATVCDFVCIALLLPFVLGFCLSVFSFSFFIFFLIIIFILITILFYFNLFYFTVFYFILHSFFLSIFSPFYSEPCGWKAFGAPARRQDCASETGEPNSGHWSTRDLPTPCNIKLQKSPRDLHLNAKTQLHSTTSWLQYWTPCAKQLGRQEHKPIH